VAEGKLSAGHARALLGSPDSAAQEELARLAVDEELTVREVEDLVRRQVHGDEPPADAAEAPAPDPKPQPEAQPEPGATKPAAVLELETLLADRLDTRVQVAMGARRGRITIEFATIDDLERIYGVISGGSPDQPSA
jgi:ParB family chromosome partitioning protein